MTPRIIFRHPDWMLLDKPEGYTVQQLIDSYSPAFPEFHPAHRLDKDTSGLWLVALNKRANRILSHAFQERSVQKAYLAVTGKTPKKKQGTIIGDMERSRRGQWQLCKTRINPAITSFKSVGMKEGKRLVLCRPETGKTHQIRVAMKSVGSPIEGDTIYAPGSAKESDRLYLHSFALLFEWEGERFSFQSEPASGKWFAGEAYDQAMNGFRNPFNLEGYANAAACD